jgi:hypothetical protein
MINLIYLRAQSEEGRILIISPPTIDIPLLEKVGAGDMRSSEVSAKYAATVMDVAREFERLDPTIGSLDFYHILEDKISADNEGSVKDYLSDGLHLGPKVICALLMNRQAANFLRGQSSAVQRYRGESERDVGGYRSQESACDGEYSV